MGANHGQLAILKDDANTSNWAFVTTAEVKLLLG
jgi:hypothetical protein